MNVSRRSCCNCFSLSLSINCAYAFTYAHTYTYAYSYTHPIIPWGAWLALMQREHQKSSVRAKVEHDFGVVKGLLKFKKTRYRALRKQTAKFNFMFALANLILADRPCPAA